MGGVAFATTVAISTPLRDGRQVTRRRHVGPPPRRGLRRASWGRTDYSNPRSATSPRPASREFVPAASFRTTMVAGVWAGSACAYAGGYTSTVTLPPFTLLSGLRKVMVMPPVMSGSSMRVTSFEPGCTSQKNLTGRGVLTALTSA